MPGRDDFSAFFVVFETVVVLLVDPLGLSVEPGFDGLLGLGLLGLGLLGLGRIRIGIDRVFGVLLALNPNLATIEWVAVPRHRP